MRCLVWEMLDGTVRVTVPVTPKLPDVTEAAYLDALAAHALAVDPSLAGATRRADHDAAALPSYEFRGAWRISAGRVIIAPALETAERWRRVRVERNAKLLESDKAILQAMDQGVKVAEWKIYRQALRDVPQANPDPKAILWPVPPVLSQPIGEVTL